MTRLVLGFAALTLLAACGVQGDLERPNPMWNSEHAIASECHRERTHREPLDSRCRQSMTVQPQSTVTPPQSPTAPSANGTIDQTSPANPDTTTPTTTTP